MNWFTNYIKNAFRMLTPLEMAMKELVEAQQSELGAQSAVEFSQSIVTYNRQRVARLKAYVSKETTP